MENDFENESERTTHWNTTGRQASQVIQFFKWLNASILVVVVTVVGHFTPSIAANEREVYLVQHGSYDYHQDTRDKFANSLQVVDSSIAAFKREMVHQGLWDNVAVVSSSDFGRTLTSNGLGTDHAWAGNYFVAGGSVTGGQMHGAYPEELSEGNPLDSGRGRMIPTMPWEVRTATHFFAICNMS